MDAAEREELMSARETLVETLNRALNPIRLPVDEALLQGMVDEIDEMLGRDENGAEGG